MIKKSVYNALCAFSYISAIVLLADYMSKAVPHDPPILTPIGVLSLFVFSAAIMGYLFVLGPLELLMAGQRNEAVKYFFTTVISFACIAAVMLVTVGLFIK